MFTMLFMKLKQNNENKKTTWQKWRVLHKKAFNQVELHVQQCWQSNKIRLYWYNGEKPVYLTLCVRGLVTHSPSTWVSFLSACLSPLIPPFILASFFGLNRALGKAHREERGESNTSRVDRLTGGGTMGAPIWSRSHGRSYGFLSLPHGNISLFLPSFIIILHQSLSHSDGCSSVWTFLLLFHAV